MTPLELTIVVCILAIGFNLWALWGFLSEIRDLKKQVRYWQEVAIGYKDEREEMCRRLERTKRQDQTHRAYLEHVLLNRLGWNPAVVELTLSELAAGNWWNPVSETPRTGVKQDCTKPQGKADRKNQPKDGLNRLPDQP